MTTVISDVAGETLQRMLTRLGKDHARAVENTLFYDHRKSLVDHLVATYYTDEDLLRLFPNQTTAIVAKLRSYPTLPKQAT